MYRIALYLRGLFREPYHVSWPLTGRLLNFCRQTLNPLVSGSLILSCQLTDWTCIKNCDMEENQTRTVSFFVMAPLVNPAGKEGISVKEENKSY